MILQVALVQHIAPLGRIATLVRTCRELHMTRRVTAFATNVLSARLTALAVQAPYAYHARAKRRRLVTFATPGIEETSTSSNALLCAIKFARKIYYYD